MAFVVLAGFASLSAGVVVSLTVIHHWVLARNAAVRTAWLTDTAKVVNPPATGWWLQGIWAANFIPLVIWRRWRHLIVWLVVGVLVDNLSITYAETIERPRRLGIAILGDWNGYATPSVPLAVLSAFLVCTVYALIPTGRSRDRAKAVVAVVILLVTCARLYLAQDGPTDARFGIVVGVTIALIAFPVLVPNDVFPVTYHRGRTAHLQINEREDAAIKRAMQDQSGMIPTAGGSFPSGHAVAAVTAIGAVLVLVPPGRQRRRWMILAIAVACVMSLARVCLRAHWLSDCVAGSLFGSGIALFWPALLQPLSARRQPPPSAPSQKEQTWQDG